MKNYKLLTVLSLILILGACNPKTILQKEPDKRLEETLYFDDANVADPFLDSLEYREYQNITIKTKLIPPPPPPAAKYKKVEGFRLQLFAGSDSLQTVSEKYNATSIVKDTLYILNERGLYKLQLGDYLYRTQADSARRVMKDKGYSGAWVVKGLVNVPNTDEDTDSSSVVEPVQQNGLSQNLEQFSIQFAAFSDETDAMTEVDKIRGLFSESVYYKKIDGLFKVYSGHFATHEKAELYLKRVREGGYPQAWITKEQN